MFEASEHLWQVWGFILNVILPLLLSCCGFSALGCRVSPHSSSSATQLLLQHLQSCWGSWTQEKGAVTPQETDPDLPMSVQEAPAEAWIGSGLLQGRGHCVGQCVHWTFRRRSPSSSPLFGLRPSNREGTQPRPSTENWIKDLLNCGLGEDS